MNAHGFVGMAELRTDLDELLQNFVRRHASFHGAMERCVTDLRSLLFLRSGDVV
jgi:hypothetical protein